MLNQDYDLSHADIQLLANRDALAAFFARLGYNTNVRLPQSIAAMGITTESLKANIIHIERLASEDRLFEVYLFELKSVTVAATQGIVRNFRNRPGDYLLVLTDTYERLDFVLVERYTSEIANVQEYTPLAGPLTPPQVSIRPRILSVNRRNPDEVALRVLRRFSYTESDTFAQYDKLLSAYDVADWSEPFFNNRALFSDYYLTKRLPDEPLWDDRNEAAAMTRAFRQLRELYADVRDTFNNQPEQIVRTKLLEPVLTILGFVAQPVKSSSSSEIEPDYRLYGRVEASSTPTEPLALCLTYTWGAVWMARTSSVTMKHPTRTLVPPLSPCLIAVRPIGLSSPTAKSGASTPRKPIAVPPTTTRLTWKRPLPCLPPIWNTPSATSGCSSGLRPSLLSLID